MSIFGSFLAIITLLILLTSPVAGSPVEPLPPILKQGMAGEEVAHLQSKLLELGFYTDAVDGKFGTQTRLAVMHFQQATGIEPDGVVGTLTWQALREYHEQPELSRSGGNERKGQQIAAFATRYLGTPYAWSGQTPGGFDCSGFIVYVLEHFGITVPRTADEQFAVGQWVSRTELKPGDLVFFSTYAPGPSHVGIYLGGDLFIHASSAAGEVTVTSMKKEYYVARYLGARRLLK